MEEITEHLVEVYVRAPESLDPGTRRIIEHCIRISTELQLIEAYWRSYYDELEALSDHESPHVRRFVDQLFPAARAIELQPLPRRPGAARHVSVLAALTREKDASRRFDTLATLGSDEEGIVVRLVYDHHKEAGRLYVLTDEPQDRDHVLITIPDLPGHFITNFAGQCEFDLDEAGRERIAGLRRMMLRRPSAYCEVHPTDSSPDGVSELILSDHRALVVRMSEGAMHATVKLLHPDAVAPTWAAYESSDRSPVLVEIADGAFELPHGNDAYAVRFYT